MLLPAAFAGWRIWFVSLIYWFGCVLRWAFVVVVVFALSVCGGLLVGIVLLVCCQWLCLVFCIVVFRDDCGVFRWLCLFCYLVKCGL